MSNLRCTRCDFYINVSYISHFPKSPLSPLLSTIVSLQIILLLSCLAMANSSHMVNFSAPRGFSTTFKSDCKETFFPDDPFDKFKDEKPLLKAKKTIQYFIPLFEWLPKYNLRLLRYDLLAGITITSLSIPQGISYAKLGELPPIIGLCKFLLKME